MDTAPLGTLTVSRLCLGTMLMGDSTPAAEAHRMLDRYVAAGGNFLDTADTYGDGGAEPAPPPRPATVARSARPRPGPPTTATRWCSPPRCASRSPTPAARVWRPTASS